MSQVNNIAEIIDDRQYDEYWLKGYYTDYRNSRCYIMKRELYEYRIKILTAMNEECNKVLTKEQIENN